MMETTNKPLTSIDDLMDAEFGKTGTRQREAFRKEAYDYCVKSNLERKQKKIKKKGCKSLSICSLFTIYKSPLFMISYNEDNIRYTFPS